MQDLTRINSLVFSYWTKTLDIIQRGLDARGISCIRFDGTMSTEKRATAVSRFNGDPRIKVLLMSISCGGVG
jgi:SNF2 family DNA or RNA helicase